MSVPGIGLLVSKRSTLRWLIHLGGPGLILIGLADNSIVPLPGSMDIMTILLAAHQRNLWFYYALMATAGSVIGGYLTYRMARKGGKETLERKFSKKQVNSVYARFSRWGLAAVAIPALLPPPFPIVPMLLAAGAMQYSTRKFLAALSLGRAIRYSALAFLGARYGHSIIRFFSRYSKPAMAVLVSMSVLGATYALARYLRAGNRPKGGRTQRRSPGAQAA